MTKPRMNQKATVKQEKQARLIKFILSIAGCATLDEARVKAKTNGRLASELIQAGVEL